MKRLDALARAPFFGGLDQETLAAIGRSGRLARFGPGDVVVRPGDRHRGLHFVLEGTLEARLEERSGTLSRIGPGECFGEMSVIDEKPASAWVVAESAVRLLRVPEQRVFTDLLARRGFARGLLRLLSDRLRHTLERQAAWEQVRKELVLAREIQASMLPPPGVLFPERSDVACAAAMEPATEVCGDFYDAFYLDEQRLFFAVGDVAGKGIGAALFMARALTLLRAEALRRRSPHDAVARVNEALENEQATFVALVCAVLDTATGALRYANGGGGAPFVRAGGRWSRLPMPRGLVVGAIPGFAFEAGRARLSPGDLLLLFSDGVTEARSPAGELFGAARLLAVLEDTAAASAEGVVEAVRAAVAAFADGGRPADDLTLLAVELKADAADAAAHGPEAATAS